MLTRPELAELDWACFDCVAVLTEARKKKTFDPAIYSRHQGSGLWAALEDRREDGSHFLDPVRTDSSSWSLLFLLSSF